MGKGSFWGSGRCVCSGPAAALGSSGTNYSQYLLLCLDYCVLSLRWDGRKRPTWCLLWFTLCLLNFPGKWKFAHIFILYIYVLQRYWQIPLVFRLPWLHRPSYPCPQELGVGNAPVVLVFRDQNVNPFLSHTWTEKLVTTIHVACVHQGGSSCSAGMFLPLLWMCPAVRSGNPAPFPHFFFHRPGVNLNNIAVQAAVLFSLLSLINVVRRSLLHQESILITCLLASHLVWTPSLPFRNNFCKEGVKITYFETHQLLRSVIIFPYPGKCWLKLSQISSYLIRKE